MCCDKSVLPHLFARDGGCVGITLSSLCQLAEECPMSIVYLGTCQGLLSRALCKFLPQGGFYGVASCFAGIQANPLQIPFAGLLSILAHTQLANCLCQV